MKRKIHLRGIPCNCHKRWRSCFLTSISNREKVTCRNCLRVRKPWLTFKP